MIFFSLYFVFYCAEEKNLQGHDSSIIRALHPEPRTRAHTHSIPTLESTIRVRIDRLLKLQQSSTCNSAKNPQKRVKTKAEQDQRPTQASDPNQQTQYLRDWEMRTAETPSRTRTRNTPPGLSSGKSPCLRATLQEHNPKKHRKPAGFSRRTRWSSKTRRRRFYLSSTLEMDSTRVSRVVWVGGQKGRKGEAD